MSCYFKLIIWFGAILSKTILAGFILTSKIFTIKKYLMNDAGFHKIQKNTYISANKTKYKKYSIKYTFKKIQISCRIIHKHTSKNYAQ